MPVSPHRSGFTLLELSIALVIIGLLAGGIFSGSTLIRSMELKSIMTETADMRTLVSTFHTRYHGLPGDITNATKVWGEVGDVDNSLSCPDDAGTGTETCDGNGDRRVAPTTITLTDAGQAPESFRAWQQLQQAGLLSSSMTGLAASGGARDSVIGTNIPASQYSKAAGWSLFFIPHSSETTGNCKQITSSGGFARSVCRFAGGGNNWIFMERTYGNVLTLGEQLDDNFAVNPLLPPQEAKGLDEKYDDGLPGTGSLVAIGDYAGDSNTTADCFEAADPTGAGYTTQLDYSISESKKACSLLFPLD